MNFATVIDEKFEELINDPIQGSIANKFVLSLANGFENGKWRLSSFHSFIWDNIKETALSAQERNSLIGMESSILDAAAKNLRLTDKEDDIGKGSELAEIVLYGIMRHHYHALPVVPKIFYKQNAQDNAKGADSVHIVVDENEDFTLWFGEAKFYTSIEDVRLGTIVTSVKNSLHKDKISKENAIISNVSDIDHLGLSDDLKMRIKDSLSQQRSLDELKPKINIPILLIHECQITKKAIEFTDDYKKELATYHLERAISYYTKQLKGLTDIFKYDHITFHLILLPVPSKKEIVDKFVAKVEFLKESSNG